MVALFLFFFFFFSKIYLSSETVNSTGHFGSDWTSEILRITGSIAQLFTIHKRIRIRRTKFILIWCAEISFSW
ncbi:hypothetical protein F4678DRAFT_420326 [Xylaria arbuscula]|nr:hypothetical protein F4678DRAFT_420326 [Xylaria arbuscula]